MITICTASTTADFEGIIMLQKNNLAKYLPEAEKLTEGFLMVQHQLSDLETFAASAPQLIAKEGEKIVGYLLVMTKSLRDSIQMLIPMFEQFDQILHQDHAIKDFNYITVGQVCVGKEARGKGVLDKLYSEYKTLFQDQYDFAITEIAKSNTRSMKGHARVGFEVVHSFQDQYESWNIVIWDWKKLF